MNISVLEEAEETASITNESCFDVCGSNSMLAHQAAGLIDDASVQKCQSMEKTAYRHPIRSVLIPRWQPLKYIHNGRIVPVLHHVQQTKERLFAVARLQTSR